MTPVPNTDARELDKLLRKVSYVQLGPAMDTEGVRARESLVTEFIRETRGKALDGSVGYNVLDAGHAFP